MPGGQLFADYGSTWRSAGTAGQRLLFGGFVYCVRAYAFSVAFPLYGAARGLGNGEIGFLIAIAAFTLFILGVPVTILGARGHSKKLLVTGSAIAAIGVLVLTVAPADATWLLRLGAFLSGCGAAAFWILVDPLLADVTEEGQRAHLYALKFFIITVGFALGGGLGGWIPGLLEASGLMSLTGALAATLVLAAALDLFAAAIFAFTPTPRRVHAAAPRAAEPGKRRRGEFVAWAVMLALVVPELGMSVGHNSIRPFLSLFYTERFGMASAETGTLIAIAALLAGAGSLATPRIAARIGNLPAIAVLRVVGSGCILLWFTGVGMTPVVGLMFLYYLANDGTEAIFITEAMSRLPPDRRTWFSGIYGMSWSLASFIAASASGVMQDRSGFALAFAVGAFGYLSSVVWMLIVFPRLPNLRRRAAALEGQPAVELIG